ncbi:MAG: GNAT family N-acetyltransferase [Acholeplasma sp.]|jgi:predicted N-acetyltransferase YhbS/uncharacterized ubiquitin-like protein YukD|nr:MAG: GNAT family N-acetyltransferase [Acholeplasma sp.]
MIFRHAKQEESEDIINLATKVFKPNMGKQFIRLFSPNNHEHQMIAEDQGKIVAAVNYYHTLMDTSIGTLSVASIGAVCTEESYRGQGISSKLLGLAEAKMMKKQVDFCIISGDGPLYQRFGARYEGAMSRYILKNDPINHDINIRKFSSDPQLLYPIYQKEAIKYQRSSEEFNDLFIAQTYPDNYQSYPVYVMYQNESMISYIILVNHPKAKLLSVKEYAGDRLAIIQSLPFLIKHYHKEGIELTTSIHDPIKKWIKEEEEKITQHATIKIINEESLFSKINRFFKVNHYPLLLEKKDGNYIIYCNEKPYLLDYNQLHALIFSGKIPIDLRQRIIYDVFPIELPWSHNLNYQ